MNSVKYILIDVEKQARTLERSGTQTEGLIANSSIDKFFCNAVLFRSDQDKFNVGAERQTEGHIANSSLLMIVNSSLPMGINLSVLPLRSVQDEFSEIHSH
jgi:hypothetical protein